MSQSIRQQGGKSTDKDVPKIHTCENKDIAIVPSPLILDTPEPNQLHPLSVTTLEDKEEPSSTNEIVHPDQSPNAWNIEEFDDPPLLSMSLSEDSENPHEVLGTMENAEDLASEYKYGKRMGLFNGKGFNDHKNPPGGKLCEGEVLPSGLQVTDGNVVELSPLPFDEKAVISHKIQHQSTKEDDLTAKSIPFRSSMPGTAFLIQQQSDHLMEEFF